MSESLLSPVRECYVCHTTQGLHKHHVYPGGRRKNSEKEGCWVWLCGYHHNLSNAGVHFDRDLDMRIRRECQIAWMERGGTIEEFRRLFSRSYL